VQILHIVCLKRDCAVKEGVEDDTSRPEISLETRIPTVSNDLWGDVSWRAALLTHNLTLADLLRDSEIRDLNLSLTVQEDVVQLDVTMKDIASVQIP
jgi:hypothetical protein